MFADYERLVLEDYHQKKIGNKLPIGLTLPTPAKLKSECERLCSERFNRKDEQVIRDFFGKGGDQKVCLQAIQQCNPDKFKPLIKFLNGGTNKTSEKNIQLLAWLIDFPDRPYDYSRKYKSQTEIKVGNDTLELVRNTSIEEAPLPEEAEVSNEDNRGGESLSETEMVGRGRKQEIEPVRSKIKLRKAVTAAVLLVATAAGGYWWRDATRAKDIIPGNGGCMYWADDHFQQIPCNQKMPNTLVVALDTVRVKNFKKITRPDTITHSSKGCVWYSKIDTKLEFFTAAGEHPVVIGRRLKPISDYIINKYIRPGMALGQ
jgi:hypothetical protein